MDKDEIEAEAIRIVRDEVTSLEDASVFITDRVEFMLRPLFRQLRKNYWGVFDEPIDPISGRKKIWPPLTETLVEHSIPNYDLDQKDIQYLARTEKGHATVALVKPLVSDYLSSIQFGERLDVLERALGIDGTAIWKIWEQDGRPEIRLVDRLNLYVDPQADTLQDTTVIERAVIPVEQVKASGWMNVDQVKGKPDLAPVDATRLITTQPRGKTLYVDVYERWGVAPLSLFTGKEDDKDKLVESQIIVSGLDGRNPILHKLVKNTKKDPKTGKPLKPYEEVRYTKVPNRFDGRGPAEKAIMLQTWMNLVINTRINRNIVAQLGLFKIRSNSGITPQMLSRLPSMGAVKVNSMDDLEQLVVQEAGQSSYTDESIIQGWARSVTSAFEAVTGEGLPASTPATNAMLQAEGARGAFKQVRNNLSSFLQRVIDRHVLPILAKNIKKGDVIRILGDDDKIDEYLDRLVSYYAEEKFEKMLDKGQIPNPQSVQAAIDAEKLRLSKDTALFTKLTRELLADDIDTKVVVGTQELDTGSIVTNLINTLNIAPELRDVIAPQIFNFLGLQLPKNLPQPVPQGRMGQQVQQGPGIAAREGGANPGRPIG